MDISLSKPVFGQVSIPDEHLVGVFSPKSLDVPGLTDGEIREAISQPIGTSSIRESASGCKNALIVTDDNTRETPLPRLLPPILDELELAGVATESITFLIGLGTHRAMTQEEINTKFGACIASKYKIVNHQWDNPEHLASFGMCDHGFEIVVNKLVENADFIISVGSIYPHATVGFSGGGKTIMPGICGEQTIENTHWMALDYSMSEILGREKNPIRDTINALCKKIGLGIIVNSILFDGDKIFGVVAGDFVAAHSKGVELCRQVYGVEIAEQADIVIAEAYPSDIDLRQAIKAICSADLVCRDNGVIILAADCKEGIAPQFPDFEKYGFRDPETLFEQVNNGRFKSKLMAYTLVAIGRVISERTRCILVSPNISSKQAERMGFLWAADIEQATIKARALTSENARIMVLRNADILLPIVGGSEV